MTLPYYILTLLFLLSLQTQGSVDIEYSPEIYQTDTGYSLRITAAKDNQLIRDYSEDKKIKINNEKINFQFQNGIARTGWNEEDDGLLFLTYKGKEGTSYRLFHFEIKRDEVLKKHIPLWLSVLPPLIAIALALIFKEVVVSLIAGIGLGAFIANGYRLENIFTSLFNILDKYILHSMLDSGHLSVILFSLLIGGMVAIISRNGGMAGIVNKLSRFARSAKSSQLITWFLGICIFFDDYANTLIVGNTMRPVTDRFKVSREKLAYIVDSTAAPVAAIAFVTTWIGAELGYIEDATAGLEINESAYSIFFNSLQFSFYPIFAILLMLILILCQRDFGPMLKAERRARTTGQLFDETVKRGKAPVDNSLKALEPAEGTKQHWYNAFFPVLSVIMVTIAGLIITGYDTAVWNSDLSFFKRISALIGNADSYIALLWGSFTGVLLAGILTLAGRVMTLKETVESLMDGLKTMLPAVIILVLAWSLALTTKDLRTAEFLTSLISGQLPPQVMPAITFVLSAVIAFSTGSSWGTMAILYPLVIPASWALSMESGLEYNDSIMILYNVISVVLAGSVLGDHCSPISDTTILSSLASSCNHIDHVRTQLPYALLAGITSLLTGGFFVLLGLHWILNFIFGGILVYLSARFFSKRISKE